ncbi:MAG: bifunctional 3-deoxy-7-phosphoheptulonate synthase/chorismate mutase [Bdellovibrionales bacterium]|nr:bifunctional 3-deoxy-7-phosphoheptulonate synthase/chorismate mutase [Bdellovibrionales bacterium]
MTKKQGADIESVKELRQEIDSIDETILQLLSRRREKSREVAKKKADSEAPLRDQSREQQLLVDRIRRGKEQDLDRHFVTRIFHEIIEDSLRQQHQLFRSGGEEDLSQAPALRIALQGTRGSFSSLASNSFFGRRGDRYRLIGCRTYAEAIGDVESGKADYAVLPVESSVTGANHDVYDLIQKSKLSIVGEEFVETNPSLLGLPGTKLASLRTVYASPQMVGLCSRFIAEHGFRVEYLSNTPASAELLSDNSDGTKAVIAAEDLASVLGLEVIKREISNYPKTVTRFFIASREPESIDLRIPSKVSALFITEQVPGALAEVLQVFRRSGINLTKLESRPIPSNPGEELFFLDFEGNLEEEHVDQALSEMKRRTKFFRVLGCYPGFHLNATQPPREAFLSSEGQSVALSGVVARQEKARKSKEKPKLFSRDYKAEDTIISLKGVTLGGNNFTVIAGPCSVESPEQIAACARHTRETGAHILRGGCFKPRTSPYSFQGLGYPGLDLLKKAGDQYGLPVVTEVLAVEDVQRVAEQSDILQIGARNMQNFTLLQEVGRTHRPVMLKRGMSCTVDDLLHAAEYILSQGNLQVFLCERGIRTFETATRNTLDLSAIPVLKEKTHLPIIVDPSHAAGARQWIIPLAKAAKAVGAHGIMVEFHPEPEKALSDGPQALYFDQFEQLMREVL